MAQDIAVSASRARLQCRFDGEAAWKEVDGASDITETEVAGASTTTASFRNAVTDVAPPGVGSLGITVPLWLPSNPVHRRLARAAKGGENVAIRFATRHRELFPAVDSAVASAAIAAATGVVTFTGTGPPDLSTGDYGSGIALLIGGAIYPCRILYSEDGSVAANAVIADPAPGSAVAAAAFSILIPSMRWQILSGKFPAGGAIALSQGVFVSSSLTYQPASAVPEPTFHATQAAALPA